MFPGGPPFFGGGGPMPFGGPGMPGPPGMFPGLPGPPGMGPPGMGPQGMMPGMGHPGMVSGGMGSQGMGPHSGMGPEAGMGPGDGGGAVGNRTGPFLKTRMCNDWKAGNCRFGERCKYAHGEEEMRQHQQMRAEAGGAGLGPGSMRQGGDMDPEGRGKLKKTRLCDKFMATGSCMYGTKCTFAHGFEELKQTQELKAMSHTMARVEGGPGGPHVSQQGGQQDHHFNRGKGNIMGPGKAAMPVAHVPQVQGAGKQGISGGGHVTASSAGPATASASAPSKQEVTFIDRVRAICGILNIGNAAAISKEKPAALQAAIAAIKNGTAFRENPFADDVEGYLPRASAA